MNVAKYKKKKVIINLLKPEGNFTCQKV